MLNQFKLNFFRLAQGEKGFTLIELFTAIFLLTIGLLGTAALTAGVIRGNIAGKNLTTATAIAQSCLQENRRGGWLHECRDNRMYDDDHERAIGRRDILQGIVDRYGDQRENSYRDRYMVRGYSWEQISQYEYDHSLRHVSSCTIGITPNWLDLPSSK